MAEVLQTVGLILAAAKELFAAAEKIAGAKAVLRDIADRANLVVANLESVQSILTLMRDKLKPKMSQDEFNQLQNPLVMCISSCRTKLDESFGLFDSHGHRVTEPTIIRRLKIATRNQRIRDDRSTLDSVIAQLHFAITAFNTQLTLMQIDRRESISVEEESELPVRDTMDQVNKRTQRHIEQVERCPSDCENDSIRADDFSRVDSVIDIDDSDDKDYVTPDMQAELQREADKNEWSIIHQSVKDADFKIVELLLQSTPDFRNAVDSKGQTPLHHCASGAGITDAVQKAKTLLRHGADVDSGDASDPKRTPLSLAVRVTWTPEQEEMVKLLIDSGATVDTRTLSSRWTDYTCLKPYASR